jgi:hypothetical protein
MQGGGKDEEEVWMKRGEEQEEEVWCLAVDYFSS